MEDNKSLTDYEFKKEETVAHAPATLGLVFKNEGMLIRPVTFSYAISFFVLNTWTVFFIHYVLKKIYFTDGKFEDLEISELSTPPELPEVMKKDKSTKTDTE